jgi:dynein heavy chain
MDLKKRSKTKDETPEYKVPLEPIAVTLKKKDLLSRIYDQGFSPYPMASISRPITDNSHYKPVTTTLYSLSNKMTKPKKQTQNSILFNVPEQSYLNPHEEDMLKSKHSAFMHTTSMFYGKQKRLVQGDGQRADPHHIHIHEENFNDHNEPIPKNPNFGQTSNSNAFAIPGMGNTKKSTGMASNLKTGNMRTYSNSKGFKQTEITGQDGPFGAVHEQRDTIEGSQTGFKTFYHTHKEATGIHGAEKLKEIENAKHVINKLRGAEDRAANLSLGEKSKGETAGRKEDPDGAAKMETEEASQEPGARKDSPVHKVTELDIYIELIIKNSSTLDEFMYLKPDPESDNPYKLELTNYNEIDDNSEYYTISGKGFSHYKNGQPIEFIPLKDWLDERETFKKIQSLQFFQKFRKWKTLKRWRKSCQKYKRDKYKANLSQKLFISNDFLRESLFKHRVLCFNMSQEKFIELKNPGDTNDAINLNDFAMMQASKKKHVHEKIKRYSDECRKIVKEGFTKNLDHLRNEVFVKKGNENITRPESTNLIRIKENAYEGLGFTNDMSYDQRSQVRNVCVNFLRFSFLIDFLALDALSTIYIRSVLELREKFESLAHLEGERILTDLEKGKNLFRGKLPMFKIDIEFCENSPNEPEEIEDVEVKFFDMPEAQEADPALFRDYNMKAHPFLIDFSGLKDNEKIQKRQVEEFDDSKKFRQQKVTNIEKMWLNLNPNMGRFIAEIKKIFPDGINALSSFERWSKHPDTVPYSAILEEWDDQIGKDSEGLDSNYLNPDHWINEDFKSSNTDAIQKLLETAFSRSSGYLEQFKEYLQVYWEYKNLDVDMLINENLAKPRITFRSIFKLLEYHKMTFELKIPFQADIGLMRIASEALKTELKVKPDDMRKIIEEKLPVELRKRCDNLKEWFDECAKEVSKQNDGDIEQFILQRKVLEQTEQYFPLIKERIKVVEDLYKVLKDFVVDVPKNDYALFMDIKTKDSNLNTELNNKTNELSKQQEQQIKILNNEMIKKLFDDIRDLSELVKDGLYLDSELDEETTIIELNEHYSKVLAFKKKCTDYNSYQIAFGTDKTDFEAVRTLETTVKAKKILWESLRDWDALVKKYEETLFKFIDHKTIKAEADKQSMNVSIIRRSIDTNNILLKKLDSNIKSFGKTMPVVVALKNELLTKVDHEKIRNLIGQEQLDLETIRLKDLIDMEIFNFQNEIVKISTQVTQEYELGLQLDALDREWEQAKFDLIVYKDQKEQVYVLTKIPDTVAKIDKLLAGINSIYANRYLDKLKDRVAKRRDDTLMISTLLDEWIRFQAQWIYLERIFSTPEFKKELKEVGTFEKINVEYRKQSRTVFNKNSGLLSKNIMELKTKVLPMLESSNKTLHVINKSINDFLDFKRSKIRRLHFISNDEMIILLAKSSEIDEVNKYIGKLFENVNKLKLGEKVTNYEGVLSREGEQLTFPNNFHLSISERGLDIWMDELEKNIRDAITKDLKQAYEKIFESETREEFYRTKLMSQAMTVANQVYWTYNTKLNIEEQKENPESLWTWYKDIEKNIQLMTDLVRSGELEGYRHVTICSIVTGEVHNRDVVYALVEKGVSSVADFAWEQQLRYELVDTSGG